MKSHFITLLIFLVSCSDLFAQKSIKETFISPLKIPFSFSGNFGELRSSHFHSGLDFRTQGRTGIPIYAAKDGYISRISVSPTGYGKALYMTHPDGNTTVYGHLDKFIPAIEEYVKEKQYYTESFKINVTLSAGEFNFMQGELIAYSGNSGSSGGPHLHFEIRDTKSENIRNPLFYIPGIKDNSAPKISSVCIYPLSDNSQVNRSGDKKTFQVIPGQRSYSLKNNQPIEVYGKIGFGIQATDLYSGAGITCGIYSARLLCDGKQLFGFKMDQFSFDQTGYANSQVDFEDLIINRRRIHRLYKQPGNELNIYEPANNDGIIDLEDGKSHNIEIIVSDAFNNNSILKFSVISRKFQAPVTEFPSAKVFQYNRENRLENSDIKLKIPKGALYDDFRFFYGTGAKPKNLYSKIHEIHDPTIPLHKAMSLSIKVEGLPEHLEDKSLIVLCNKSNAISASIGGEYSNGWVSASASNFGNFAIAVDTVPPSIVPLSIQDKKTLTNNVKIQFRISDNLSGIKTIRGEIDGAWVLFEYDAKTKTISHTFDKSKITFGKTHQLSLVLLDNKDNRSEYKATFFK